MMVISQSVYLCLVTAMLLLMASCLYYIRGMHR